jgi:uncharacterized protein YnzC (UPF0291/DUF896 family)
LSTSLAEANANEIIERHLGDRFTALEDVVGGDALSYVGPIYPFVADWVKYGLEKLENRRRSLFVLLETVGGYIESAERIANIFRHHYKRVEFIVPSYAMSAGTVLVMSGDAIHMDYSSVLGPIDPQIQRDQNQPFIPALGYVEKFNELVEKSQNDNLTFAELQWLVQRFDPGELYRIEQERELSVSLLKEWIVKYKFRDWKKTDTQGKRVTPKMREERAEEVARELNNTGRWHSHGRGIPMSVLRKDLKLQIEDFGESEDLDKKIREYQRLLRDYMMRRSHEIVLHTRGGYVGI